MACKKRCYKTEDEARAALRKMHQNPVDPWHMPNDVYRCHGCKSWHLTSMMPKFRQKFGDNRKRRNR